MTTLSTHGAGWACQVGRGNYCFSNYRMEMRDWDLRERLIVPLRERERVECQMNDRCHISISPAERVSAITKSKTILKRRACPHQGQKVSENVRIKVMRV